MLETTIPENQIKDLINKYGVQKEKVKEEFLLLSPYLTGGLRNYDIIDYNRKKIILK